MSSTLLKKKQCLGLGANISQTGTNSNEFPLHAFEVASPPTLSLNAVTVTKTGEPSIPSSLNQLADLATTELHSIAPSLPRNSLTVSTVSSVADSRTTIPSPSNQVTVADGESTQSAVQTPTPSPSKPQAQFSIPKRNKDMVKGLVPPNSHNSSVISSATSPSSLSATHTSMRSLKRDSNYSLADTHNHYAIARDVTAQAQRAVPSIQPTSFYNSPAPLLPDVLRHPSRPLPSSRSGPQLLLLSKARSPPVSSFAELPTSSAIALQNSSGIALQNSSGIALQNSFHHPIASSHMSSTPIRAYSHISDQHMPPPPHEILAEAAVARGRRGRGRAPRGSTSSLHLRSELIPPAAASPTPRTRDSTRGRYVSRAAAKAAALAAQLSEIPVVISSDEEDDDDAEAETPVAQPETAEQNGAVEQSSDASAAVPMHSLDGAAPQTDQNTRATTEGDSANVLWEKVEIQLGPRKRVNITQADMRTLEPFEFLNDTIINFYLSYIECIVLSHPELQERIHVFNTFFYTKLIAKPTGPTPPRGGAGRSQRQQPTTTRNAPISPALSTSTSTSPSSGRTGGAVAAIAAAFRKRQPGDGAPDTPASKRALAGNAQPDFVASAEATDTVPLPPHVLLRMADAAHSGYRQPAKAPSPAAASRPQPLQRIYASEASARQRHENVKNWTRNVDLFSKDFIFIPINLDSHWFLAIICYPNLVPAATAAAATATATETERDVKQQKRSDTPSSSASASASASASSTAPKPAEHEPVAADAGPGPSTGETSTDAAVPSDASCSSTPTPAPTSEPAPEPVQDAKPKPKLKLALPHSHIDLQALLESPAAAPGDETNEQYAKIGSVSKSPMIVIMDSLKGTIRDAYRNPIVRNLKEYLQMEYDTRQLQQTGVRKLFTQLPGAMAHPPTQTNHWDCGIYLLLYVERFFTKPIVDLSKPFLCELHRWWFTTTDVEGKRDQLKALIYELAARQLDADRLAGRKGAKRAARLAVDSSASSQSAAAAGSQVWSDCPLYTPADTDEHTDTLTFLDAVDDTDGVGSQVVCGFDPEDLTHPALQICPVDSKKSKATTATSAHPTSRDASTAPGAAAALPLPTTAHTTQSPPKASRANCAVPDVVQHSAPHSNEETEAAKNDQRASPPAPVSVGEPVAAQTESEPAVSDEPNDFVEPETTVGGADEVLEEPPVGEQEELLSQAPFGEAGELVLEPPVGFADELAAQTSVAEVALPLTPRARALSVSSPANPELAGPVDTAFRRISYTAASSPVYPLPAVRISSATKPSSELFAQPLPAALGAPMTLTAATGAEAAAAALEEASGSSSTLQLQMHFNSPHSTRIHAPAHWEQQQLSFGVGVGLAPPAPSPLAPGPLQAEAEILKLRQESDEYRINAPHLSSSQQLHLQPQPLQPFPPQLQLLEGSAGAASGAAVEELASNSNGDEISGALGHVRLDDAGDALQAPLAIPQMCSSALHSVQPLPPPDLVSASTSFYSAAGDEDDEPDGDVEMSEPL